MARARQRLDHPPLRPAPLPPRRQPHLPGGVLKPAPLIHCPSGLSAYHPGEDLGRFEPLPARLRGINERCGPRRKGQPGGGRALRPARFARRGPERAEPSGHPGPSLAARAGV
jgi:hypothetical protein